MKRLLVRLALVFLCIAACPPGAQAQDDAFKQGLDARGNRRWADVVRHMQAAVKVDPQESTRKVRSGLSGLVGAGTEYLPHYFLGEAYFNLQDCGSAVNEWSLSEQQNAVRVRSEFVALIRKGYQACAAKGVLLPADYNPLYAATSKPYTDATAVARRISDLGALQKDVWRPDVDEQYARARRDLETAQTELNTAQRTRLAVDFNKSRAATERAMQVLRPLEGRLNAAAETFTSIQRQVQEIEPVLTGADAADRALEVVKASLTDVMQVSRKSARDQIAGVRERIATAQKPQNTASLADALKVAQQNAEALSDALKAAQSATTTLNQVLEQAKKLARGVFEQQFADAIRLADEALARVAAAMAILDKRASQKPALMRPQLTTERASLERQTDSLRRRLDRARKAEDLAGVAETTRLARETQVGFDRLIQVFGPLTLRDRGVHEALEEGGRLFLQGEYEKALSALMPLPQDAQVSFRVHAHVFRAASLYALYARSGETKQDLLEQALAAITQAKQLDPSFQPNPKAFSPRFLALYSSGAAAPVSTASR